MKLILQLSKVLFLLLFSCVIVSNAHAEDTNLIANGSFEQLTDGIAKNWIILEGTNGSEATFPAIKEKGNIGHVDIPSGAKKGAYIAQWVNLEPNQDYRLSMQAMMTEGKITFGIGSNGLNIRMFGEGREELPMSPWFWDESWLKSVPFVPGQWREVSFDFNSKDVKRVLISLGGYFAQGSYSFDNVTLVKLKN